MSLNAAEDMFFASQRRQACGLGHHVWLPWLEIEAKGLSDLYEGDMATESHITRCSNCGKRERWNV